MSSLGYKNSLTAEYIKTEDDAEDILALFDIKEPPVPSSLVKKLFPDSEIQVTPFHPDAFGFSFPKNGKWYVLLNQGLSVGAKRFTLFHEFYHMLQNNPGYNKETEEGMVEERKAEYFAACLLMPARWFRKYWEKYHDIEKMSEKFLVSRKAVEIRLKSLEHYLAA